jgi:hypothetical protein
MSNVSDVSEYRSAQWFLADIFWSLHRLDVDGVIDVSETFHLHLYELSV